MPKVRRLFQTIIGRWIALGMASLDLAALIPDLPLPPGLLTIAGLLIAWGMTTKAYWKATGTALTTHVCLPLKAPIPWNFPNQGFPGDNVWLITLEITNESKGRDLRGFIGGNIQGLVRLADNSDPRYYGNFPIRWSEKAPAVSAKCHIDQGTSQSFNLCLAGSHVVRFLLPDKVVGQSVQVGDQMGFTLELRDFDDHVCAFDFTMTFDNKGQPRIRLASPQQVRSKGGSPLG